MLGWAIVFATLAIVAGFFFEKKFVGEEQHEFWRGAIFTATNNHVLGELHAPLLIVQAPLIAAVIGLLIAVYMYLMRGGRGARLAALLDQLREVGVSGCLEFPPVNLLSDRPLQQLRWREPVLLELTMQLIGEIYLQSRHARKYTHSP